MTDGADEELSFSEIQERLHVPEEDVTRLTHSLSCAKYKILNKSPASKTVSKTDVFSMNKKFTDRMRRIRVRMRVLFAANVVLCRQDAAQSAKHLLQFCYWKVAMRPVLQLG